jgi:hypothetical protein
MMDDRPDIDFYVRVMMMWWDARILAQTSIRDFRHH